MWVMSLSKSFSMPSKNHLTLRIFNTCPNFVSRILTPLADIANWLHRNIASAPNTILQCILQKQKNVFKGISMQKYQQVKLLIDKTVDPMKQQQQQQKIPEQSQLGTILDELKAWHIIYLVERPTDWIYPTSFLLQKLTQHRSALTLTCRSQTQPYIKPDTSYQRSKSYRTSSTTRSTSPS